MGNKERQRNDFSRLHVLDLPILSGQPQRAAPNSSSKIGHCEVLGPGKTRPLHVQGLVSELLRLRILLNVVDRAQIPDSGNLARHSRCVASNLRLRNMFWFHKKKKY